MIDSKDTRPLNILIAETIQIIALDLQEEARAAAPTATIEIWQGNTGWPEMSEPDLVFWALDVSGEERMKQFEYFSSRASRMVAIGDSFDRAVLPAHVSHLAVPFSPTEVASHVTACLSVSDRTSSQRSAQP
ncbi:hypothetical protein [Pelagovum pacificum]|uniref:Uncharacterized protein n=1 Tax=Pelagovum pacificum TaxID=2588711 RepID=A0A5C5GAV2_9RHOB|nr:hypothetical protein [Pelagovum pacificum]QQA41870.1 hypothetical protein I8N54_13830 [Pelagovum pacificum]TNY30687.1 hypothetical protein FHY64_19100 [Pelagovum pacificum]